MIKGKATNVFYQTPKGDYYLAQLTVFEDGVVKISRIPEPLLGHINHINQMFTEGITTQLEINTTLHILGLGNFVITTKNNVTDTDKIQEITQIYNALL